MTQPVEQPALPQTHVLSYVTAINTPTRVRLVASISLVIISNLATVGGIAGLYVLGRTFYDSISWALGPGMPAMTLPQMLDLLRDQFWYMPGGVLRLALMVVTAPTLLSPLLLILARAVYLGRRIPCLLARSFLLVPILQILLASAIYYGWAILAHDERGHLLRFLTLPVPVLAVLLLLDLRSFLQWIARNPVAEKPPTPFLPGRAA